MARSAWPEGGSERWTAAASPRRKVPRASNHTAARRQKSLRPHLSTRTLLASLPGTSAVDGAMSALRFVCDRSNMTTVASLALLATYFLAGVAFFSGVEGWNVGDVFYFAIVVLMTVGYGDVRPITDRAKLFTCFYSVFALVIAACAVSNLMDAATRYAAERARELTQQSSSKSGILAKLDRARSSRRRRFFKNVGVFLLLILSGTAFFGIFKDWDLEYSDGMEGNVWVDSFYLTVLTLTTMGFGDFSCKSPAERAFGSFFMLIGIPTFAGCLQAFTEYVFGDQKDKVRLELVQGGLTVESFDGMEDFCGRLRDCLDHDCLGTSSLPGGPDVSDDGLISRFEFLSFLLVENNVATLQMIREAMSNFSELDADNSEYISREDLSAWVVARAAAATTPKKTQHIRARAAAKVAELWSATGR